MLHRRANVAGATYFITVNLLERRKALLTDHIDLLRDSIRWTKERHPFNLDAMVVLPDYFHLLMTLPADDANCSCRIGAIKSRFSRCLPKTERIGESRRDKRERGIWQRRFWEHLIRGDRNYANHVDYIYINPVKHGFIKRAIDWPHSSIHRFVANGTLTAE